MTRFKAPTEARVLPFPNLAAAIECLRETGAPQADELAAAVAAREAKFPRSGFRNLPDVLVTTVQRSDLPPNEARHAKHGDILIKDAFVHELDGVATVLQVVEDR